MLQETYIKLWQSAVTFGANIKTYFT